MKRTDERADGQAAEDEREGLSLGADLGGAAAVRVDRRLVGW